jgi:predicted secreted protein
MSRGIADGILARLDDQRGRKVVFLSHCLLNENTRYQGGAFTCGMLVPLVEEAASRGYGIVQMPCPEQLAWGGVAKRFMRFSYGLDSSASVLKRAKGFLSAVFVMYSRCRFRRIARGVVRQIRDYRQSGCEVVAVVGIDGSPTCGLARRINLGRGLRFHAALPPGGLARADYNRELYGQCAEPGPGLFFRELEKLLAREGLGVPLVAHDLPGESRGDDWAGFDRCRV